MSLRSRTPLASKSGTSPAICESSRDGSNASMVRIPERPATRPAQVDATSGPSAVTAPIPVTTTRRVIGLLAGRTVDSPDQLPGADRGRAIDVAGQAARRNRVGHGDRVELGAPDLCRDRLLIEGHQGPRRRRVTIEDVAGTAGIDDHLPAEVADVRQVGVTAADDAR